MPIYGASGFRGSARGGNSAAIPAYPMKSRFFGRFVALALGVWVARAGAAESVLAAAQTLAPEENFPRFVVPGQERAMAALNTMHRLHFPPVWLDYPNRDPAAGLCTRSEEHTSELQSH